MIGALVTFAFLILWVYGGVRMILEVRRLEATRERLDVVIVKLDQADEVASVDPELVVLRGLLERFRAGFYYDDGEWLHTTAMGHDPASPDEVRLLSELRDGT